MSCFLVTGGSGFIGSAYIRFLINSTNHQVINIDKLTYASNLESLEMVEKNPRYHFVEGDILDEKLLGKLFQDFHPDYVVHLAAESHVDRSIQNSRNFIETNIIGTYNLLEISRRYWLSLSSKERLKFKFHHISTDEVFGSLSSIGLFNEKSPYDPSSPYSASKAGSDHLVRSWHKTYGLPTLISNCSNNYGPYQFPEKLIPLTIMNAMEEKPITIYGDGMNVRDWIFVEDHVEAMYAVILKGEAGNSYCIGGDNQKTNVEVVEELCNILDAILPRNMSPQSSYHDLITFIKDRPGHDFRYAIESSKIHKNLQWKPAETFQSGLEKTVQWYIKNISWLKNTKSSTKTS
ncbi:MAG TPA: dTDP-glucose 4,6-dehydratase [Woeseiaceae bacterium]|nr:dTDP-glucose 4,6-dehydratase [Woeseiaceae bacterium]